MRHRKGFNHLGRTSSHRKAMLSNMANSLLLHKRITTTLAKAKELRSFVEPLITRAKEDSTHNRREVFSDLKSKQVVTELFRDIIVKIGDRPGGYTRILKTGNRMGDNAEMCMIELVDYNENMLPTHKADTAKKRRTRKTKTTGTPAVEKEAKKVEAPVAAPVAAPVEASEEVPVADPVEAPAEDQAQATSEEEVS